MNPRIEGAELPDISWFPGFLIDSGLNCSKAPILDIEIDLECTHLHDEWTNTNDRALAEDVDTVSARR